MPQNQVFAQAKGTFNTIGNKSFADSTRLKSLNSFLKTWSDAFPETSLDALTPDQFITNEGLLRESANKLTKQLDMLEKGDLDQESFFASADDVFKEVMDRMDLTRKTQFDVSQGSGVVQEFTGDTLTKETQIQPTSELGIDDSIIQKAEAIPGITKEAIAQEMGIADVEAAMTNADSANKKTLIFRDFLNARFGLQEKAIAKRDGVTTADVEKYVRTEIMRKGSDPETLLRQLMRGYRRVPPSLTEATIKLYTDQGIPREEVIEKFNQKFGQQNAGQQ